MSGAGETADVWGRGAGVELRRPAGEGRLLSLDVLRGLSVAGMILVTDPGSYAAVYPQLLHASWEGATATDMIFPCFLFAVGVSIPIAVGARLWRGETAERLLRAVLRRTLLLIAIGLVLNAYPGFHLRTLRLPGVLQRIGLCYGAGALLYLAAAGQEARRRMVLLVAVAAALLVGYGALLLLLPVPGYGAGHLDTLRSLPAYVDRAVFTIPHLWAYGITPGVGVTFDPEGLLSTLPAISAVLLGMVVGETVRDRREGGSAAGLGWVAGAGVGLIGPALVLRPVMPMIKKLWTPSFSLLSSGIAMLVFALLYWTIDVRRWRRGWLPARIFGTNAIVAFAVSGVLTATLDLLRVRGASWHAWGYAHLFLPWLSPVNASLAYAVLIVALNCAVVAVLYRRGLFVRL